MGLGSLIDLGLAGARDEALQARKVVNAGKNPIDERRRQRVAAEAVVPFGELMDQVVAAKASEWRNPLSLHQWERTAEVELAPLRDMKPHEVTTEDVLRVLRPIWTGTPETGRRLRGRLEHFLDAAKARGLREGDNPARWRGHLSLLLGQRQRLTRGHHAAVPFAQAKEFFCALRAANGLAARALELTILTAARSGEVLGACGDEFDLETGVWTVPAGRMKAGHQHRVPLSTTAWMIVAARVETCGAGLLFPGPRRGRTLSNMTMPKVMKTLSYGAFTVHGWRATFRTWAGERTSFPRELVEMALAHQVGDATERAYSRGDGLDRRRQLMEAWGQHCEPVAGNVVRIA